MVKKALEVVLGLIFSGLIVPTVAAMPALEDPLLNADLSSEHIAGATNAAAALGNGRLTVGISPWSEIIYFRWPRPSFYDHLRYITKAYGFIGFNNPRDTRWGDDAASLDWRRYGRPYEVDPELGSRGALRLKDGSYTWFGDPSWTSSRAYVPEWSPVLCTTITRSDATVLACQWVDGEDDLLIQDFKINSSAAQKFFYYATFDPCQKRAGYWGAPDPKSAGFATVYLEHQGIILYFQPRHKNEFRLKKHLKEKFTAELIDRLYPQGGFFVAMGFSERPDGFQVGGDRQGKGVPDSAPFAASEEARKGKLGGSRYFIGQADAGLEKNIFQTSIRVSVLISAAESAKQAVALIENARAKGIDELRAKAVSDLKPLADRVELPSSASASEKRVARRSILNLLVGRDRESGAIIASPSRQPAYYYDWPRDGSFYDLSLDLAGFPEIAGSHIDFYRRTQRKGSLDLSITWLLGGKPLFYSPRGHWYSNSYTDGSPGKFKIIPVEIDETSLLTWDLWRHEQFIPKSGRPEYQKDHLEQLTLAADAILEYVNVKKGWTKKVFEDDHPIPRATLHGAASVLAGLAAAADAGKRWEAKPEKVKRWQEAAIALRQGILRRIEMDKMLESGGWRGVQWSLFPAPVFESYDDPRAQILIDKLAAEIEQKADKKRPGFAYLGEQLFILGIATAKKPEYRPLIQRGVNVLVNEVPMLGTDCYGEVTLWIDLPGQPGKVAQQRTSIPHLWTGVTTYLAVEALYRPERFLTQIPPIPK